MRSQSTNSGVLWPSSVVEPILELWKINARYMRILKRAPHVEVLKLHILSDGADDLCQIVHVQSEMMSDYIRVSCRMVLNLNNLNNPEKWIN